MNANQSNGTKPPLTKIRSLFNFNRWDGSDLLSPEEAKLLTTDVDWSRVDLWTGIALELHSTSSTVGANPGCVNSLSNNVVSADGQYANPLLLFQPHGSMPPVPAPPPPTASASASASGVVTTAKKRGRPKGSKNKKKAAPAPCSDMSSFAEHVNAVMYSSGGASNGVSSCYNATGIAVVNHMQPRRVMYDSDETWDENMATPPLVDDDIMDEDGDLTEEETSFHVALGHDLRAHDPMVANMIQQVTGLGGSTEQIASARDFGDDEYYCRGRERSGGWLKLEDTRLLQYLQLPRDGNNARSASLFWRKCSEYVRTRSSTQCMHRWYTLYPHLRRLQDNLHSGERVKKRYLWSQEEDMLLRDIMRKHLLDRFGLAVDWKWVANELRKKQEDLNMKPTYRSHKSCRDRWEAVLNPNNRKFHLCEEQKQRMLVLYQDLCGRVPSCGKQSLWNLIRAQLGLSVQFPLQTLRNIHAQLKRRKQ